MGKGERGSGASPRALARVGGWVRVRSEPPRAQPRAHPVTTPCASVCAPPAFRFSAPNLAGVVVGLAGSIAYSGEDRLRGGGRLFGGPNVWGDRILEGDMFSWIAPR